MMYSVEFTEVYWASIHGRFILMAYQVLSHCSSSPLATEFDKICKLKLKDHISGSSLVSISFTRHATVLDKVQLIKNRHCFQILDSQFPWNNYYSMILRCLKHNLFVKMLCFCVWHFCLDSLFELRQESFIEHHNICLSKFIVLFSHICTLFYTFVYIHCLILSKGNHSCHI